MPRGRHRASFDQVFEFDRGRIVAYRGSVNVLDEVKQCDVDLYSLDAGGNDRPMGPIAPISYLRHQWCDERLTWTTEWNDIVFTDESRIFLQHHDDRIRVWRHNGERVLNCCVMHHPTGTALGIMQDNALPHMALYVQEFFTHPNELLLWPPFSPDLSPTDNVWFMLAQLLFRDTPFAAPPDQLWQNAEVAWIAIPQAYIQSVFDSISRRVAVVIANNDSYTKY
ncbi:transposable element Tcb1 transposase [Trichonephila clavipes]|nr:transposable element Tcb1 transposase [Trichonephila clavipes]